MSEETKEAQEVEKPQRKRSVTSVTLGWLAEKLRKTQALKDKIASGQYHVDSHKVAAAIANEESRPSE